MEVMSEVCFILGDISLQTTHLHFRDVGVCWGVTMMGLGNLGLSLADVLGSGVEGRVRHGDSL